jgi:hypothetical protein
VRNRYYPLTISGLITAAAIFVAAAMLPFVSCSRPVPGESEKLLDVLDSELASVDKYVAEREARIRFLEDMRNRLDVSGEQLFQINNRLCDEFFSFQFDRAQYYLNANLELARRRYLLRPHRLLHHRDVGKPDRTCGRLRGYCMAVSPQKGSLMIRPEEGPLG